MRGKRTGKTCSTSLWRHNGRDGVSNHQPHHCLLNRVFRRRSKKISTLRVTGLCAGNSPLIGEFPAQMASNAENASIWSTSSSSSSFIIIIIITIFFIIIIIIIIIIITIIITIIIIVIITIIGGFGLISSWPLPSLTPSSPPPSAET